MEPRFLKFIGMTNRVFASSSTIRDLLMPEDWMTDTWWSYALNAGGLKCMVMSYHNASGARPTYSRSQDFSVTGGFGQQGRGGRDVCGGTFFLLEGQPEPLRLPCLEDFCTLRLE